MVELGSTGVSWGQSLSLRPGHRALHSLVLGSGRTDFSVALNALHKSMARMPPQSCLVAKAIHGVSRAVSADAAVWGHASCKSHVEWPPEASACPHEFGSYPRLREAATPIPLYLLPGLWVPDPCIPRCPSGSPFLWQDSVVCLHRLGMV